MAETDQAAKISEISAKIVKTLDFVMFWLLGII